MGMAMSIPSPQPRSAARGVVLIVVLLFMLAISAIAVFAARSFTLSERLARNEMANQAARQAAEAALRDGERDLMLDSTALPAGALCKRTAGFRGEDKNTYEFNAACTQGECALPAARYNVGWNNASINTPGEPWWPVSKGGVWNDTFENTQPNTNVAPNCTFTGGIPLGLYTGAPKIAGVARQPEYLIELLTPAQDTDLQAKDFECPTAIGAGNSVASDGVVIASNNTVPLPCHVFRITARGWGPTTDTEIVMQSYFSSKK